LDSSLGSSAKLVWTNTVSASKAQIRNQRCMSHVSHAALYKASTCLLDIQNSPQRRTYEDNTQALALFLYPSTLKHA
jgi:hypothetical protein